MHQLRFMTKTRLALAAAAMLATTLAQAAPLASGQATLTGIRYELIDLRPDDGQTPWIRFGNAEGQPLTGLLDATGVSHNDGAANFGTWQGLLPAEAINLTSKDGYSAAQAGASSLGTSFTVDTSVLGQLAPIDDGTGRARVEVFSQVRTGNGIPSLAYAVDEETGAVDAVDGSTAWQPFDFTLSAHTALVVHADASASVTLDPLAGGWDIRNPGQSTDNEPMIGSGVQIALTLLRPDFTMQAHYGSTDEFYADMDKAYQLSFDGLSADWTPDDASTLAPASRSLLVRLDNDAGLETRGALTITGMSQFAVTQAVPEPGTWALMGLGLLAMAGVGRARRKARLA